MEEIQERQGTELGVIKAQTQEEFLVKIGAKEEEFDWDPRITNEPIKRSTSYVCAEYTKPAVYRTKPKHLTVNAWKCQSQASRQLTLVASRFGPKNFYINNQNVQNISDSYLAGPSTQAYGLCYSPRTVTSL